MFSVSITSVSAEELGMHNDMVFRKLASPLVHARKMQESQQSVCLCVCVHLCVYAHCGPTFDSAVYSWKACVGVRGGLGYSTTAPQPVRSFIFWKLPLSLGARLNIKKRETRSSAFYLIFNIDIFCRKICSLPFYFDEKKGGCRAPSPLVCTDTRLKFTSFLHNMHQRKRNVLS